MYCHVSSIEPDLLVVNGFVLYLHSSALFPIKILRTCSKQIL